jgi:hypothetical protein
MHFLALISKIQSDYTITPKGVTSFFLGTTWFLDLELPLYRHQRVVAINRALDWTPICEVLRLNLWDGG